ncbi:MAG: alpha/beta fold hydrolase, partial [Gammaproteobacteria bacterium]|nr:alpha/beta fold hydrolase [Gammaproteobacteria bacterium]
MIRRGYADCDDGQVHFREAGDRNAPPVCLFHQTASSGAMFEKVMARLSDRYRLLAFDTPGFGQSFQPAEIPSLSYPGDMMMQAIGNLGIERFHAVGHHTGGSIATELPVRYPERVASLTIIGPVLVNDAEREEYKKTFVRPFAIEPTGAFLETAWKYLEMIGASSSAELQTRELADHLIAHNTMPMAFSAVWRQDFESYFRKVGCPMLLMCSKDD